MIYKSNLMTAINKIKQKIDFTPNEIDQVLRKAASSVQGDMGRRVFNEGKASKGGLIGSYSTKPTLVGRKSFVNKGAWESVYKNKKYAWVTYKGRKLKLLDGGYKMIRQLEGKDTSTVNLTRSGKLSKSLIFEPMNGGYRIGFLPYGADLSKYQEKHFNKPIFELTAYEKRSISIIFNDFIKKKLNG